MPARSRPLLVLDDPIVALGVLLSGVGIACLPAVYAERADVRSTGG